MLDEVDEKPRRTNVTIYDISERLGISAATVSRALNGNRRVSAKTRERVLAAAREMGYRRNSAARSLRTGRSNIVAFITDNLSSPLVSAMAAGAEGWLREREWALFVVDGGEDFKDAASFLSFFARSQIAGVLVAGSRIHTVDDSWLEGHPAVCAFCFPASGRFPSILTDDLSGAYIATKHLIEQGYRRIGLINGPADWWAAQQRLEGYKRALEEHGIPFEPGWVENGDWKPEGGYRKALELLQRADLDGIFVANDYMAVGALWAASELGLRVPEQLGIIGFDNREVTQIARPKLSTVVLPMHEVGRLAAEALYRRIVEPEAEAPAPAHAPGRVFVPCTLVVRNSSTTRADVHEDEFPFY